MIGFLARPWRGMALWRSLAWQALDFPLGIVLGVLVTVLVAVRMDRGPQVGWVRLISTIRASTTGVI